MAVVNDELRRTMMNFLVCIADLLREDGADQDEFKRWRSNAWNADAILGRPCGHCGGTGRVMVGKYVLGCLGPAHAGPTEPTNG